MLIAGLSRGLNFPMRAGNRFSTQSKLSATTIAAESVMSSTAPAQHPSYDVIEESMITEYGCKAILYRYMTIQFYRYPTPETPVLSLHHPS